MGNKCHQEAGSTCKIYTILFLVKNHKLMILMFQSTCALTLSVKASIGSYSAQLSECALYIETVMLSGPMMLSL